MRLSPGSGTVTIACGISSKSISGSGQDHRINIKCSWHIGANFYNFLLDKLYSL